MILKVKGQGHVQNGGQLVKNAFITFQIHCRNQITLPNQIIGHGESISDVTLKVRSQGVKVMSKMGVKYQNCMCIIC